MDGVNLGRRARTPSRVPLRARTDGPGGGRGRASDTFSPSMSATGAVHRGESTRSLEEAAASQPGAQRRWRASPGRRRATPGDPGAHGMTPGDPGRSASTLSPSMSATGAVHRGESARSLEEAVASQTGAQRRRRASPGRRRRKPPHPLDCNAARSFAQHERHRRGPPRGIGPSLGEAAASQPGAQRRRRASPGRRRRKPPHPLDCDAGASHGVRRNGQSPAMKPGTFSSFRRSPPDDQRRLRMGDACVAPPLSSRRPAFVYPERERTVRIIYFFYVVHLLAQLIPHDLVPFHVVGRDHVEAAVRQ